MFLLSYKIFRCLNLFSWYGFLYICTNKQFSFKARPRCSLFLQGGLFLCLKVKLLTLPIRRLPALDGISVIRISIIALREIACWRWRGQPFFCSRLTSNLILSKSSIELLTVQITPAQLRLLDHISPLDAYDRVKDINNIIYNAVGSDTTDDESMRQMLLLSDAILDIAFENLKNAKRWNIT